MWTWLSLAILIMGAEFNSEIEHQTCRDSTIGPETPMGTRGAIMADTIGARYDRPDSPAGGRLDGPDPTRRLFAAGRCAGPTGQPSPLADILLAGVLVLVIDTVLEVNKRLDRLRR